MSRVIQFDRNQPYLLTPANEWLTTGESLFLQKLVWASLPNKLQKLRDR
jgi:hypothetical protein